MANFKATKIITCLGFILYLAGCGEIESESPTRDSNDTEAKVILHSDLSTVDYGGQITLNWTTHGVQDCIASGDWLGSKNTTGSEIISSLTADSNFELTCTAMDGEAIASKGRKIKDTVNVKVRGPKPPAISLSASPTFVAMNGSTTINWSSRHSESCIASGDWSGVLATSGSRTISTLTTDSTFILSCSGAGGSTTDSVSVTVVSPSAPSVNLSASPLSLPYNGSTTLSWNSNNATDCIASGDWSGNKSISGSQTISALTADSSFNLSCSGAGGSANDSVRVTVAVPLPTLSFSANPSSVSENGSTTLSWNSNNATDCIASGGWSGNKGASGAETIISLTMDSEFTLTCNGAGGAIAETVNVTVTVSNNDLTRPSVNLTNENNNIYLSWSQSNANLYRVLYWQGNNAPEEHTTTGTEYTFPPLNTGNYTVVVEAYDVMGNSLFSAPVTLEVL